MSYVELPNDGPEWDELDNQIFDRAHCDCPHPPHVHTMASGCTECSCDARWDYE